ncbi:MAG: hypothetical protein RMK45_03940 [Armatimonadota bacterium]|nr:hypothetical protein [Armatimonadota bacterium]
MHKLQALDDYLDQLRHEVAQLDSGEQLRARIERSRERLQHAKTRYEQTHTTAVEQERRLQEIDQRIRRTEADLYSGRITNSRELQLLQREIDHAKQTRNAMELELLRIWEQMETMKQDIDAAEQSLREMERLYEAHLEDFRQRKAVLEFEIQFHMQERAELVAQLEPEALQRYEKIRERLGGTAVALVEQKACTVCHTLLTPHMLRRLQTESTLLTCESCGRLLYDPHLAG